MDFLQNAKKGKNEWWQYLLTIIAVIMAHFIGQIPLGLVVFMKMSERHLSVSEGQDAIDNLEFGVFGISENYAMFLLLMSFIASFIALFLMVKYLHKRSFTSLITTNSTIDWSKIFYAFSFWMLFTIIIEVVAYLIDPSIYTFQFQAAPFFLLLLMALFILPIQTSFEELLFRGYMMQGLVSITTSRWIPLLITSLLFGLVHSMNPEIEEFGLGIMMTYYIGVGLFLGIITLLDNSLELALGIHAATNIYGALFVSFKGSALQTPALFRISEMNVSMMLVMFFAMAALFIVMAGRKYKWSSSLSTV